MATLVNRTVWFVYAVSIKRGVVIRQNFDPGSITIRCEDMPDYVTGPQEAFLTPEGAIAEARNRARLLDGSARELESFLAGLESAKI